MLKKIARMIVVPLFDRAARLLVKETVREAHIVAYRCDDDEVEEVLRRGQYYVPELAISVTRIDSWRQFPLRLLLSKNPILLVGADYSLSQRAILNLFNVDSRRNHVEAWDWHRLLDYVNPGPQPGVDTAHQRFLDYLAEIGRSGYDRAYVFGTGPSLSKALDYDWGDGYRVVCNTIVRSDDLWHHIRPHFILAGDAIHHFSHTRYATSFRQDLRKRLEASDTRFVYPAVFHHFVLREFSDLADKLIPIAASHHEDICVDLRRNFSKAALNNVLTMLQLPVACTLSKQVMLFGYDGRSKTDKMFWSSSILYNYTEFMPELHETFPRFFNHYVGRKDENAYVKLVHGDELDRKMTKAEERGWRFVMLHKSHTATLQKRFDADCLPQRARQDNAVTAAAESAG